MNITPVILCGGSGTRLWPLSRQQYPKQFVDWGQGHTLFDDTVRRAMALPDAGEPLVICNEDYRFYAKAGLDTCGVRGEILLEPAPRNTAPAIALAAFCSEARGGGLLLVLPSDHAIHNNDVFAAGVAEASALAEQGYLVTFGIVPTAAETGFGYIKQGEPLSKRGYKVARFVEKPDHAHATAMLHEGGYFWNSGMFVFAASAYLRELQLYMPEMYDTCREAYTKGARDSVFYRPEKTVFLACPSESIDYAVMEKTTHAAVCPVPLEWNDLGSWEALHQTGDKDTANNVLTGDVLAEGVRNCYVHSQSRLVAALDVDNLAIVETRDAVLVAARDSVQKVKNIVATLEAQERPEGHDNPVVYRPWGSYESLASAPGFQVKRIVVNPGAQLSLQLHHHRSEHWIVVSGTAEVTNGDTVSRFTANQSTYIPVEVKHRLKNPTDAPLVLIEVQCGEYLGEDDIERFDDVYGR